MWNAERLTQCSGWCPVLSILHQQTERPPAGFLRQCTKCTDSILYIDTSRLIDKLCFVKHSTAEPG